MRRAHWSCAIACLALLSAGNAAQISSQTALAVFDRQFPQQTVSFLLLDAHSGTILAERWPDSATPVPVGSLIKPFTAMAWAATKRPFPTIKCHGTRDACWLPRGHGTMTLQSAITQSCNAYFLALGRGLSLQEANTTLSEYGLPSVDPTDKTMAMAGLSSSWRVTPEALATAYLKLERAAVRHKFQPLLEGMRESGAIGTARAASTALPGNAVLGKTGTATCSHTPRAMADGFTVLFFPAEDPRILLLVREHGVTGAESAAIAGQMVRSLEVGDR